MQSSVHAQPFNLLNCRFSVYRQLEMAATKAPLRALIEAPSYSEAASTSGQRSRAEVSPSRRLRPAIDAHGSWQWLTGGYVWLQGHACRKYRRTSQNPDSILLGMRERLVKSRTSKSKYKVPCIPITICCPSRDPQKPSKMQASDLEAPQTAFHGHSAANTVIRAAESVPHIAIGGHRG